MQEHRQGKEAREAIFYKYARPRGYDAASAMLMKRLRIIITDKKLAMHSLRHRMKVKLRNAGCPEAISMAILKHDSNKVAANYGSGYALDLMREHMSVQNLFNSQRSLSHLSNVKLRRHASLTEWRSLIAC